MIVQAVELGADVLWLPACVAILAATRVGRDIVERRAPWVIPGLEREPIDEGRCTCHSSKTCAYCLLREWRAEREELESCSSD